MDEELVIKAIKRVMSPQRFLHSLGVQDTAEKLAAKYGADVKKASLAGLLHDYARDLENSSLLKKSIDFSMSINEVERLAPVLLHGRIGAKLVQEELGIDDDEVLSSISYHTTGTLSMTLLQQIIYVADYIEPSRDFPGVQKIREATWNNLDLGTLEAFEHTLSYLLERKVLIHPATVEGRNFLLSKLYINRNGGQ